MYLDALDHLAHDAVVVLRFVRAAFGNDANAYLQHFVNYGMAEGRQGRASFNVYTYRDEHPELWEKFGDNLRGYYLWACGIPQ